MLDHTILDKEQEKLETYNNLSATLAKVSPASVAAIAPTLASVISSHSKQRQAVQDDVHDLTNVWDDFMALFVENVTRRIDVKVNSAVARIREEADIQAARIARMRASLPNNAEPPVRPAVDVPPKRKYEDEPRRWEERTPHRPNQPRYVREADRSPDEKRARLGEHPDVSSSRAYPSDSRINGHGDSLHASYPASSRVLLSHSSPGGHAHGAMNTHQAGEGQSKVPKDVDGKDQSSVGTVLPYPSVSESYSLSRLQARA
jgi:hypothetical protein